jgi:RNA polymerase sigma-54 factor
MALELKQQLRLSQQLVMTPQLQQAIKLLQLSRLELVGLVQKELEENPVLEETSEGDGTDDMEAPELVADASESAAPEASAQGEAGGEAEVSSSDEREPSDAEKIADIDWQNYMEAYPQTGMRESRDEDDRPGIEANLTRRPTLSEHLEWQLQLSNLSGEEAAVAHLVIGNLDDRGYLQATVEELAWEAAVEEKVAEEALRRVQEFDPTGVAARDLKECLQLQVRTLGVTDPIVHRIIDECLDLLIKRDFRGVSRRISIPIEDVAAAAKVIGTLEPRPGRAFGGEDPIYIVPDIYVYKVAEDFHIVLNDDGLPRLRISNLYRDVLSRGSGSPKDTRAYVHEKVRSAMWLIKSIHQRQRTIYKVMQSIIKHQREFFEKGINCLKPLNLRDVAEDIEMHESTVSRVTTNKYAHTPQGIFELKYFFNSSINQVEGDAVASEAVKERILHLIRNEDPRRPLSDQRIAEMLKVANIDIARRTVTKYREALNLLSSTKRRQVG